MSEGGTGGDIREGTASVGHRERLAFMRGPGGPGRCWVGSRYGLPYLSGPLCQMGWRVWVGVTVEAGSPGAPAWKSREQRMVVWTREVADRGLVAGSWS